MKITNMNAEKLKSSFFNPEQEQENEKPNQKVEEKTEDSESTDETEDEKLLSSVIQKAKVNGIEITNSDIINYIKKGYIEKTLEIIPDHLYATLKTLQVKETSEINTSISKDVNDYPNLIDIEYRLRSVKYSMFHYLIKLGSSRENLNELPNKANPPIKSEFFKEIDNLGHMVLFKISEKQSLLEAAIEASLNHPKIAKK